MLFKTYKIAAEYPYPLTQIEGVNSMPVQTCTFPPPFTFEDLPRVFSHTVHYTSVSNVTLLVDVLI